MSKFLLINGKPQKAANGEFITVPDAYDNEPISLSGTILKTAVGLIGNKWIAQQEDTNDYLCFTAETANSTIGLTLAGTATQGQAFEYSLDKKTWNSVVIDNTITLANVGDKVYFRGNNATVSESWDDCIQFVMTGKIAASGNIMSLLDKTCQSVTISNDFCFYSLFGDCTSLTATPELPVTILADNCYRYMFYGCTSLTSAPELPATTLTNNCYCGMFYGCTSLTAAPELPATELASGCYCVMFSGCASLITAPELPATTLAEHCYDGMFEDCTSLTAAPALPATTLAEGCYYSMFLGCTSLTSAPALPATTLAEDCYGFMFWGCISLQVYSSSGEGHTQAWNIPTSGTASDYTSQEYMFYGTRGDYSSASTVTLNTTFYTQNAPV